MKETIADRIFNVFNVIFLAGVAVVMLVPLIYVFTTSVMPSFIISKYNHTLLFPIPKYFTLESYQYIFSSNSKMVTSFMNTIQVVVVGTIANMVFTTLMAYPLSKKDLRGKTTIMVFVFVTMMVTGGLIPTYLVVKGTGLINHLAALYIPVLISPWNMIILRNFFSSLPDSLEESAYMDGASEIVILLKIIIPLSLPAMATISLFYGVERWNDFFNAFIYISDSKNWTLQIFLRQILMEATPQLLQDSQIAEQLIAKPPAVEQVKMAAIMASTIPILLVYPFLQKYFVKGVMIGSIKG